MKQDLLHEKKISKFYEVWSEWRNFNWCWFCTLMLRWYLLRRLHFYSDWLWPYCVTMHILPPNLFNCKSFIINYLGYSLTTNYLNGLTFLLLFPLCNKNGDRVERNNFRQGQLWHGLQGQKKLVKRRRKFLKSGGGLVHFFWEGGALCWNGVLHGDQDAILK